MGLNGRDAGAERTTARLEYERAVPRAAFRGELRRHLFALRRPATPPRRLGLLIAGYLGSGIALLTVTAIGLLGAGPFAA